jgi:hypothetical protein
MPPFRGTRIPSSIKEAAPVQTRRPDTNQTRTARKGEITWERTTAGAEKMPEPIWKPTTRARPLR